MNRRQPRALIVEDDATTGYFLGKLLSLWHWETDLAVTIAAAREAMRDRPYDLLILDMTLPDGHGSELIPFARELPQPPRIMVASAKPIELGRASLLETDQGFEKPYAFEALQMFADNVAGEFYRLHDAERFRIKAADGEEPCQEPGPTSH